MLQNCEWDWVVVDVIMLLMLSSGPLEHPPYYLICMLTTGMFSAGFAA
jgi:hypothetical protein